MTQPKREEAAGQVHGERDGPGLPARPSAIRHGVILLVAAGLGLLSGWSVLEWTDELVAGAIGGAVVSVIIRRTLLRLTR